ncbi:hypothetical protein A0H81_06512 [Grifola frondosa]|uniref:F-box domain-containing protein n=1 Tax=Grifola frondosa TaxID=5627 RepID=A0A1C7MAW0_GRIFR|nr:hypothetical protein A0H81_06512 [Grifola frondosa]
MTNLLSINGDVLYNILSFLPTRSGLNLAATSHALYAEAICHAISVVTLSNSPEQVTEFCAYMLADPANRLSQLRALTITSSAFCENSILSIGDYSSGPLLADVLAQTPGLRSLSLACTEHLFQSEPRISQAIISLALLEQLKLYHISPSVLDILPKMRSKPRTLALSVHASGVHAFSLSSYLTHLHYLETLDLSGFSPSHVDLQATDVAHPPWPAVRSLSLTDIGIHSSAVVHAFPNVRDLRFWGNSAHGWDMLGLQFGGCWPSLDHVHGSIYELKSWCITCPISWLQLDGIITEDPIVQRDALHVVQSVSPVTLSMEIRPGVNVSFWTRLSEAIPRLRCLELLLVTNSTNLQEWMEKIIPTLQTSNIQCLTIYVDLQDDHNRPTEISGRRMVESLCAPLARAVPSIQYLSLATG